MKSYIRKLKNRNPELLDALDMLASGGEEGEMEAILQMPMYSPFSVEEVILAFSEEMYLYGPMNGFLDVLYDEVSS